MGKTEETFISVIPYISVILGRLHAILEGSLDLSYQSKLGVSVGSLFFIEFLADYKPRGLSQKPFVKATKMADKDPDFFSHKSPSASQVTNLQKTPLFFYLSLSINLVFEYGNFFDANR